MKCIHCKIKDAIYCYNGNSVCEACYSERIIEDSKNAEIMKKLLGASIQNMKKNGLMGDEV